MTTVDDVITSFSDDPNLLTATMQPKFLRVLQEMENTADRCGCSGGPGAGVRPQEAGLAGSGAG